MPSLLNNLISLTSQVSQGHSLHIAGGSEEVQLHQAGIQVVTAKLTEVLYILHFSNQHTCHLANGESMVMQWHKKLGHTNFGTLADMKCKGVLPNCSATPPEILKARDEGICDSCMEGKMHKSSHPTRQTPPPHLNFTVHSDVMGSLKTSTISGACYVLMFIDELLRFSLVKIFSSKSVFYLRYPSSSNNSSPKGAALSRG